MMAWQPQEFLVARPGGPESVAGYVFRGLGMHKVREASPKGRRPPEWTLTHLGTGHALCRVVGFVAAAFPLATDIAMLGDWDFHGLDGYKNIAPEIKEKFKAFLLAHPKALKRLPQVAMQSDEIARQIAQARAS